MIDNKNFEETFASLIKDYNKAETHHERVEILRKFAFSILLAELHSKKFEFKMEE